MILPTMGNILIVMSFFKKYSVRLDLENNIVRFPDITLQLRPTNRTFKTKMMHMQTVQKTIIPPRQQLFIPAVAEDDIGTNRGTTEAFPAFECSTQLLVSPAVTEIKNRQSHFQVTNTFEHIITLQPGTTVAMFKLLTPNQARNAQPMTTEQPSLITKYPEEADQIINRQFQDPEIKSSRQWNSTPETCDVPSTLNKIERRIYDEIVKLRQEEKLDLTQDDELRRQFLANFDWTYTILTPQEQQQVESRLC